MTFAPPPLLEARAFLKGQDSDLSDPEVGIVGGPSHISTGTSYHLGYDQLQLSKNPYSWRVARDRIKSNAASALDIDDDLDELREMSVWIVNECRKPNPHPDTLDIREVIYSPDGINVYTWDREQGQTSAPQKRGGLSHRQHSHLSYYRDSERRDKVGIFKRFYKEREGNTMEEDFFSKDNSANAIALAWLVEGIGNMRDTIADGPNKDRPIPFVAAIKRIEEKLDALTIGGVDLAALVAALVPALTDALGSQEAAADRARADALETK